MERLRVVEVCAGAGGQSLGLHRAGFHHDLAIEIDGNAAATLRHNLERLEGAPVDVRTGDVADRDVWDPREYRDADLLAGGVPCPPFSVAGRQLGSADERDLFAWAVEQVETMKPKAVMLENVRGLSAPRFSGYRQAVVDRLAEMNYWCEWRLLYANEFGVVQLRPRFVLIAMRMEYAGRFHWPEPDPTSQTVGSVLLSLMSENGWAHAVEWSSVANGIAPTIVGGSKKHGGADLGPTRAKKAWAELYVDGRGIANAAPEAQAPSFRDQMPRLTNEMVARVQGWGAPGYEWDFLGKKTSVYRQIGNAFPPPVAERLGHAVAAAIKGSADERDVTSFDAHDELYALLRGARRAMHESEIDAAISLTGDTLTKRLQTLAKDFDLQVSGPAGQRSISLGEFRAFRGQQEHARHDAFADSYSRSRVS